MAFVSTNRVQVIPGHDEAVLTAVQQFFQARQALRQQGDLLATRLVRSPDGSEYLLISVWSSQEAHLRHEDSPAEQAALRQLAPYVTAPPVEFSGEVVAELA